MCSIMYLVHICGDTDESDENLDTGHLGCLTDVFPSKTVYTENLPALYRFLSGSDLRLLKPFSRCVALFIQIDNVCIDKAFDSIHSSMFFVSRF